MKKNLTTNIIRCIAALLVIFSHAFAIAQNKYDYLGAYTNNLINIGAFSVTILFAISGYYIMKSISEKGIEKFVKKRIVRLIPSLFITVIFSILILGFFFSNVSLTKYFTSIETYKYLLNIVFIPIHNLPGVFENNIYCATVNGALWTMMVQFLCYIYIFLYFKILYSRKKEFNNKVLIHYVLVSFVLGLIGLVVIKRLGIEVLQAMIRPFLCFVVGSGLYHIRIKKENLVFGISIILSIIFLIFNNYLVLNIWLVFLIPYIIIYLCKNIKININNKYIDYITSSSYELYLVGFPIQQAITYMNGGSMNIYYNFIIGSVIAIIFAIIVKTLSDKLIKICNL